jgi:hypothetical protein
LKVTEISMHDAVPVAATRRRGALGTVLKVVSWVLGVPVLLFGVLYVALLITPIPLPFIREQVQAAVVASLPEGYGLELGEIALAIEGGLMPVIRFTPVVLTDSETGSRVHMDALEIGFSPVKAVIGQPGAVVTLVGPHIQVVQDLFGPRLASFEVVTDEQGATTVRVIEGTSAFPTVGILPQGLSVRGGDPGIDATVRSDNDWLIYNFEAAEQSLADVVEQAEAGRFSRFVMRDGVVEMHDAVYGVLRRFDDIDLDLTPSTDGSRTTGKFAATVAGSRMETTIERVVSLDGTAHLISRGKGLDLASFMETGGSEASISGTSAFIADVSFAPETGKAVNGTFTVDMSGLRLELGGERLPIASKDIVIDWAPLTGQFTMEEAEFDVAGNRATVSGLFVLGIDDIFGPTVGVSLTAKDVWLQSDDLPAQSAPFDTLEFKGWAAPLYGAMGIDQLVISKPGSRIAAAGRIDMVRRGLGIDMTMAAERVTLDDIKLMWPAAVAPDARNWFVKNVSGGTIDHASMRLSFPAGTLPKLGEDKPVPQNGLSVDVVGSGMTVSAAEGLAPVVIDGQTRLQVRDNKITMSVDGATMDTAQGPLQVAGAAVVIDSSVPGARILEVSGDLDGGIPSMITLLKQYQPDMFKTGAMPVDPATIAGTVDANLVATVQLGANDAVTAIDYAINGSVNDFGSTAPIMGYALGGGQLAFSASPSGYRIGGTAKVADVEAGIVIEGSLAENGATLASATIDTADLKSLGFDVSEFITGDVRVVGKPLADGSLQLAVDLEKAALTIKDLGITKEAGAAGRLDAVVKQIGTRLEISQLDLGFGDVKVQGTLDVDAATGLQSAEFSSIQISPGDKAQLALTPVQGGYAVRIRGEQLDLKPMLGRFFSLGGSAGEAGTGGPQATAVNQTIVLDIMLDRALGFYRTTAYNLDLDLTVKGSDLQNVGLSAQMGGNSSISIVTNAAPDGRVMSVAYNDLGSLLRLVGVYPRVVGGQGSLVMSTNTADKSNDGELTLRNFSLVDEANVSQVVGGAARAATRSVSEMRFTSGSVKFHMADNKVEIIDGVLTGPSHGGTLRGYIYTDAKQYDLTGTYVPLSGINTLFQRLPVIGELLGGREGEGLIGVTFAVRGPLDKPDFLINPASVLAVGAFRSLFEFRAREEPSVAAGRPAQ